MNNPLSGEPITKQVSQSLVAPNTFAGYRDFFRQNSSPESGYVEVQFEKSDKWEKKWMTFDESVLNFYVDPLNRTESFSVPMDRVISFRADDNSQFPIMSITTTEKKYRIRLSNVEEMRKWLFSFQKSVALVITQILEGRKKAVNAEDQKIWLSDLGNGHGHFNARPNNVNRAYTMEDVVEKRFNARDNNGFSRLNSRTVLHDDHSSNNSSNMTSPAPKMMAVSPAIPISMNQYKPRNTAVNIPAEPQPEEDAGSFQRDRIASSFRNEEFSPLTEVMRQQPQSHHRDNYDDEEENNSVGGGSEEESGDDDDMMFAMDEHIEEKNKKEKIDKSRSNSNNSSYNGSSGIGGEMLRLTSASRNNSFKGDTAAQSTSNSRHTTPRNSFNLGDDRGPLVKVLGKPIRWESGFCTKLGPREKNEDRYVVLPQFNERVPTARVTDVLLPPTSTRPVVNNYTSGLSKSLLSTSLDAASKGSFLPGGGSDHSCGYFAVYDGHAGDLAATFLQEHLHDRISKHQLFPHELESAIIETFIDIDKEFLDICRRRNSACGTTAIGSFIIGSQLTVFNLGDSMAVLCSNGQAIEMSESHKPNRKDENERILKANGWITEEKELYMGRLHRIDYDDPLAVNKAKNMQWTTIYRLCGELALTRSIGDIDYKSFIPGQLVDAFFLWPDGHSKIFHNDLVLPEPECKSHNLGEGDEFMILASDGLWDVVSPEEAVKRAQDAFAQGKSPTQVSEELCDLALRLGSSDNVTIVIVKFYHG